MKKSKLSLGLIACLLSVGSLAGCDVVKSSDNGVLLSYTVDGGKPVEVKADNLLKEYYNDSTKYQAIFDSIYSVIKVNYFSKDRGEKTLSDGTKIKLGKPQMSKINAEAEEKVLKDETTAQDNADANGTSYKKEFESILSQNGVKTKPELLKKYVEELKKSTFDENLYEYYIDEIRGETNVPEITLSTGKKFKWDGYLKDQSPYHISHVLVSVSDDSDTSYSDGKVTESNAENLYNAVNQLASLKFMAVAGSKLNEDTTAKNSSGDLGIMDYSTTFINEFKLGIYAYEQLFLGVTPEYNEVTSPTLISTNSKKTYWSRTAELFNLPLDIQGNVTTVPTVNYSVFKDLFNCRTESTDENSHKVIEGTELVYPRNIIYNKYLNQHAAFFIEGTAEDGVNFKQVSFKNQKGETVNKNKVVLCADGDPTKPIVAVRGSSGEKKEIHFIVVNRSPFREYEVKLQDYYTTYHYASSLYPKKDGVKLDTYTNFLGEENSESKPRAEAVASKLKSYDSDKLTKYAFLKFMALEELKFTDECKDIEEALMNWISTSIDKKSEENKEKWTKTWSEYLDKLSRQSSERKKLVPQACRIGFTYGNKSITFSEAIQRKAEDLAKDMVERGQITEDDKAATIVDLHDSIKAEIVKDLIELGKATNPTTAETVLSKTVVNEFKNEGGLCNDGTQHK